MTEKGRQEPYSKHLSGHEGCGCLIETGMRPQLVELFGKYEVVWPCPLQVGFVVSSESHHP